MNFTQLLIFSLIMAVALIVFAFKYPSYYVEKDSKKQSLYAKGNEDAKKGVPPQNINKTYIEGYSDAIKVAGYEKNRKIKS